MHKLIQTIKQNILLIGALLVIGLYLAPLVVFGENSYVLIHDNLDSEIVKYTTLAESGKMFAPIDATVDQMMNGVPRASLGSEFYVLSWLFYFFSPYTAYVINQFVVRLIAFAGMYLLLKKHILKSEKDLLIIIGVSVCFALLPFWPSGGLSVLGQPLLLYAFLNIRQKASRYIDWLILILVPFYSQFLLSNFFLLALLDLLFLIDLIKTKKINTNFLLALILTTLLSVFVEYRLFYEMFIDKSFISHREEFDKLRLFGVDLEGAVVRGIDNFAFGQYHVSTLHTYLILPLAFASLFLTKNAQKQKLIFILLGLISIISLGYGLWYWTNLIEPLQNRFEIVKTFNFSRFHWLHPLLWYTVFAVSLSAVSRRIKYGRYLIMMIMVLQAGYLFYQSDYFHEYRSGSMTYKQFYSTELFSNIDRYIAKDKSTYGVASIGISPSIARYNGFYTLDGYLVNYSLDYKHQFRKVIAKELEKDNGMREYFDNFGSRCYLYADELDRNVMITRDETKLVKNLELDTEEFKKLGGKYIFSTAMLIDPQGLRFLNTFEDEDSVWKIYVYQVD